MTNTFRLTYEHVVARAGDTSSREAGHGAGCEAPPSGVHRE